MHNTKNHTSTHYYINRYHQRQSTIRMHDDEETECRKWQKFFQSVAGNALQLTSNSESGSVTSLELNCTTKVSIARSSWPSVLE